MEILGSLGTIAIAVAALTISIRQVQLAKIQNDYSDRQTRISEQLAEIEIRRSTPYLIPGEPNLTSGSVQMPLINIGGGFAHNVWIESVLFLERNRQPGRAERVSMIAHQRVAVVESMAMVTLECDPVAIFPGGVECVLAMRGNALDALGERFSINYELHPGYLSVLPGD